MNKKIIRSEGEELIEEYLNEEGIKFDDSKLKIEGLKRDSLPYRKADFYLQNYKIYIEFFGRWNIDSNKKKYIEKKNVYEMNNIPCIYLYPDNLGILNFIFKRRLKEVLKKHNMRWQLFKINWNLFQEKHLIRILVFSVFSIFADNITLKIIFIIIAIYSMIIGLKSTFFK